MEFHKNIDHILHSVHQLLDRGLGEIMNDIGLHPDAGKHEPPDHPPIAVGAKLILEVTVEVYGDPEEGMSDLRFNLLDIARRACEEGMITCLGDSEMELVDWQPYVERM